MRRIVKALQASGSRSTGKLYAEIFPTQEVPRRTFEELLGSLARASIVQLQDASFEKDGKEIPYRVARLLKTKPGDTELAEVLMKEEVSVIGASRSKKKKSTVTPPLDQKLDDPISQKIEDELKAWRTAKAKERSIPPYCVLTNQTLRNVAVAKPTAEQELNTIPGIGPIIIRTYGAEIIETVKRLCLR